MRNDLWDCVRVRSAKRERDGIVCYGRVLAYRHLVYLLREMLLVVASWCGKGSRDVGDLCVVPRLGGRLPWPLRQEARASHVRFRARAL